MRAIWALTLVLAVLNLSAVAGENKPKAQYPIRLHLRATQDCELNMAATLLLYDKYAAVIPEGRTQEWYSPELSKDDVVALPASADKNTIKAARKSGFRTTSESASPVSSAEVIHVGNGKAECATSEAAFMSADAARQQRRKEVQSHMYSASDHDVIPPHPLTEEKLADPYSVSSTGPKPKVSHGTVLTAFLVGIDGVVHDSKVVAQLDPVLDARAIEAVKRWKFLPARKLGLPVPVRIEVEVNFKGEW
jgi:TonB family protein